MANKFRRLIWTDFLHHGMNLPVSRLSITLLLFRFVLLDVAVDSVCDKLVVLGWGCCIKYSRGSLFTINGTCGTGGLSFKTLGLLGGDGPLTNISGINK